MTPTNTHSSCQDNQVQPRQPHKWDYCGDNKGQKSSSSDSSVNIVVVEYRNIYQWISITLKTIGLRTMYMCIGAYLRK